MDTSPDQILLEVHFPESPYGPYTYLPPPDAPMLSAGVRVRAPFGPRVRVGFLTGFPTEAPAAELRPLKEAVDETPLFNREMLDLTHWMAEYYLCEWGEVLQAALPGNIKFQTTWRYRLRGNLPADLFGRVDDASAEGVLAALRREALSLRQIQRRFADGVDQLRRLQHRNWIEVVEEIPPLKNPRTQTRWTWIASESYDEALQALPVNARKLRLVIEILREHKGAVKSLKLAKKQPGMAEPFRRLVKRGWVAAEEIPIDIASLAQLGLSETVIGDITLSEAQTAIIEKLSAAMDAGDSRPFLLHGVTGSGKTVVYLEAVRRALESGKTALMLAPEISLTPQLMGRFRARFGEQVILTHSGMSETERRDAWLRIRAGAARIVIGPRSAVFAPLSDLGLVIVDEEHDESYKQYDPDPRYHGRDTALYRARLNGAAALIGSATPDVASYYRAKTGKYRLLELTTRFSEGGMPKVSLVKWGLGKEDNIFSPRLLNAVRDRLERKEQTILLINRRGFSIWIRCPDCGSMAQCPNCDVTLRYHREGQKLLCHYCGHTQKAFDVCPACGKQRLRYGGIGSQRVERELQMRLPTARVIRMDLDTTRERGAHQDILRRFARREFDVLLGTKMVAKGHDFPGVTLVGILSADAEWCWPDFRAVERAFRLMVQASGRAGRTVKGEVVIQAWQPGETLLGWARQHDYAAMFRSEVAARHPLGYPPFGRLVVVRMRGPRQDEVEAAAAQLKAAIEERVKSAKVLGPVPPPVERMESVFRRQILLKFPALVTKEVIEAKKTLKACVDEARGKHFKREIYYGVDVDPLDV